MLLFSIIVSSCSHDDEIATRNSFRSSPAHPNYQPPVVNPRAGYDGRYNNGARPNSYYYGRPNSRKYYNPYDFQQPYGSNPYSDYDQYYVPPNQYYNNEYQTGVEEFYSQ